MRVLKTSFVVTAVLGAILAARPALAHGDTADGPVVATASILPTGTPAAEHGHGEADEGEATEIAPDTMVGMGAH